MPVAPEGWVARKFRALSANQRRQFLADLWAARGYETDVDGGAVVVRDAEGGPTRERTRRRLAVVGRWPWRSTTADVCVGTHDTDRARSVAAASGAEFVSPTELHRLLLYGIDRTDADAITREHFGTAVTEVSVAGASSRLASPTGLGVLAVATILVIALSLGSAPKATGAGPQFSEPSTGTQLPAMNGSSSPAPITTGGSCAGADDSRSERPLPETLTGQQLGELHEQQVEQPPQQVQFTYTGPKESTLKSGIVRETVEYRTNSSNARYTRGQRLITDEGDVIEWTDDVYVDEYSVWIHRDGRTGSLQAHIWNEFRQALAWPYQILLRTTELEVTRVTLFGEQYYRAAATGDAAARTDFPVGSASRTDFRAQVYLTPCGRLVYLIVSYRHAETGAPVTLEITYDEFEDGDVPPPPWYEEISDAR
jgi:hypothetical protein